MEQHLLATITDPHEYQHRMFSARRVAAGRGEGGRMHTASGELGTPLHSPLHVATASKTAAVGSNQTAAPREALPPLHRELTAIICRKYEALKL